MSVQSAQHNVSAHGGELSNLQSSPAGSALIVFWNKVAKIINVYFIFVNNYKCYNYLK